MVVLLARIGYNERVGEWHRPVVSRPLTASDPGCRLRMVSLAAEAAAHGRACRRPSHRQPLLRGRS
eukprot:1228652-Alexandrium_andersonii.AAC.1